jgi:hypothetical protein
VYQNATSEVVYVKALAGHYSDADVYVYIELKKCKVATAQKTCIKKEENSGDNNCKYFEKVASSSSMDGTSASSVMVCIGLESFEGRDVYVDENAKVVKFDMYHNVVKNEGSSSVGSVYNDNIDINKMNGWRSVNLNVCKQLCLEEGYGGFVVDGRDGKSRGGSISPPKIIIYPF